MRVVALLQDSRNGGGIATVNRWYLEWTARHRPGDVEVYFLDDHGAPFAFARHVLRRESAGPALPRLLPHLHLPQYPAAKQLIASAVRSADEVHVVGAVAVHGALGLGGGPMLVWFATTFGTELRAVIPLYPPARRLFWATALPFLERLEDKTLRSAQRILAMSPRTLDEVRQRHVPASLGTLPVPIDISAYAPDDSPRKGVLFVGRADDPRKNFEACLRLVHGSPVVAEHGLDVVSAGSPPAGIGQLGRETVRWWGRIEFLPPRYRQAEVLVLPSHQEGLGIVAFEAMACATPVVCFRSGGPDDFVAASGGGFVVDGEEEFRSRVEELLLDNRLRVQMGDAGRDWVKAHMSATAFLENETLFAL